MKTIAECLTTLGVTQEMLRECDTIQDEFAIVKTLYRTKILTCHPDKTGGDAEEFRKLHTSFETLRDKRHKVDSLADHLEDATEDPTLWTDIPSYDFFATAAEEEVPLYRVELAKSGRSKCKQKGKTAKKCDDVTIPLNSIRVGVWNKDTGSYWQWNHLPCWRVPSRVWLGVPQEEDAAKDEFAIALSSMCDLLLSGFDELPPADQDAFVEHVQDHDNWAKLIKRKKALAAAEPQPPQDVSDSTELMAATAAASTEKSLVSTRPVFVIPKPGENGALVEALTGKTFVLTGVFPEVGGGSGLTLGKDRVKSMIESFGGRVTTAISGKTDFLVVGKEPGESKVTKARDKKVPLVSLKDLKERGIEADCLESAPPVLIGEYSAGYQYKKLKHAVPDDDHLDDDTKPPAQKKSKTTRKKKATQNHKKTQKKTATSVSKNKKKKALEEDEEWAIACDGCGSNCTAKSWWVEADQSDWCDDCHASQNIEGAVAQVQGQPIVG